MRLALHTRLRADRIEEYEAVHAKIPAELEEVLRAGGATSWTIWRSGTDLFHVIECDDYARLIAAMEEHPANIAWQARLADIVEQSAEGTDAVLRQVWEL